jgi:hypothetical protein
MNLLKKIITSWTKFEYLIAILCLFHLTTNLIWINLNSLPFPWDQAGHTIISYKFVDFFQGRGDSPFLRISDYYPPFTHLIVAFLMLIFGRIPNIGPTVVTFFFISSIAFLYLYTIELSKNRKLAFIAALFYSFLPVNYNLSRYFLLEIPLVAMLLGSLYFLEKTQNFQNRKNVAIFSVFAGLSIFIKWTAIIYLLIPVLFKLKKGINSKNILTSALIVLAINFFWYITNYEIILNATKITATAEESDPQNILSYDNLKYYFHLMTNFQLTWLGMVAFLVSAFAFVKDLKKKSLYILAPILFVYIVFAFIGNKDLRYIIGLVPLISIIVSYGIIKLLNYDKFFSTLIISLLTIYFGVYFFSLSFGFPIDPIKQNIRNTIFVPLLGGIDLINLSRDSSYLLAPKYSTTQWPNLTIANELKDFEPKTFVKILIVAEKPFFNQVNMELSRRQLNLNKIQFYAPYDLNTLKSSEAIEDYISSYNLVLVADKDLGPQGGIRHIAIMRQIKDYLENDPSSSAKKINTYYLPDGDTLSVYKINHWPNSIIAEELSKFNPSKQVSILTVANKSRLNHDSLEEARAELELGKIKFIEADSNIDLSEDSSANDYISKFDVILAADNDLGTRNGVKNSQAIEQIKSLIDQGLLPQIKKINTYYLPDGDSISVYKVNPL